MRSDDTSDTGSRTPDGAARPRDGAARAAGVLLLVTAATTMLAVAGRVAADADQDTLRASLAAISDNSAMYALGGAARLVSGKSRS